MASNLIVARGGVEYVPPISLAFWRWTLVFIILLIFNFYFLKDKLGAIKKEFFKLFLSWIDGLWGLWSIPILSRQNNYYN